MELCLGKSPNLKNSVNRFFFSLNYRPRRLPPISSLVLIKAKPNAAVLWWWSGGADEHELQRPDSGQPCSRAAEKEAFQDFTWASLFSLISRDWRINLCCIKGRGAVRLQQMFGVYAATSVEFDSISWLELMIQLEHSSAVWTAADSLRVIWTAPLSTTIASKYWGNETTEFQCRQTITGIICFMKGCVC